MTRAWLPLIAAVALCALILVGAVYLAASASLPVGLPLGR